MSNKEYYLQNLPENLPLFHKPFWLDSVCPGEWDVAIVKEDNKIIASMPYHIKQVNGRTEINMPGLTQYHGPHLIIPTDLRNATKVKFEIEKLTDLISQLPSFSYFRQTWYYPNQNWLPFYWSGFKQTSRYTYVIDKNSNIEEIWQNFKGSVRTHVKKAEKLVAIEETTDASILYDLVVKTYTRQKIKPREFGLYERTIAAAISNKIGKLYVARDTQGRVHATAFFAWDELTYYYLVGSLNQELESASAMTLLLWKGIQEALIMKKHFDFEGSIVKNIEDFFRSFGGEQKVLFQVSKKNMNRGDYLKESIKNFKKFVLYKPGDESRPSIFQ